MHTVFVCSALVGDAGADSTISPSAVASARAATRHLRRTRNVNDLDFAFLQNADAADDAPVTGTNNNAADAPVASEDNTCFRGFQIGQAYHYDWTSDLNVRKVAIHQTQRSEHTRDFNIKLKVWLLFFVLACDGVATREINYRSSMRYSLIH